jgi:hypothetical protein
MKKNLTYLVVALLLTSGLTGCYYDEVATFDGLPTNVSLKNDVQPIFNRECALPGCHVSPIPPGHNPDLASGNSHEALTTGGFINTLDPENSVLYLSITVGGMPAGRAPLNENDKKIILGWITEGAKNN